MYNIEALKLDNRVAKDWEVMAYCGMRVSEDPSLIKQFEFTKNEVAGMKHMYELYQSHATQEELKNEYFELVEREM